MDMLHRRLTMVMVGPCWCHGPTTAVDVTRLGRFYERIGDRTVAIGRRVIYQAGGGDLESSVRI